MKNRDALCIVIIHLGNVNKKYINEICKNTVGVNTLEEKYQLIIQKEGTDISHLSRYVIQATKIQNEMREILNQLTPHICSHCEYKCCEGLPLEGWFSLEDYTLFRVKYSKPIPPPNRIRRDTACYFLTPEGCSLPEDMRPFTCVKINCEKINEYIKAIGKTQKFNQLKSALDKIHREVSHLINNIIPQSNTSKDKNRA